MPVDGSRERCARFRDAFPRRGQSEAERRRQCGRDQYRGTDCRPCAGIGSARAVRGSAALRPPLRCADPAGCRESSGARRRKGGSEAGRRRKANETSRLSTQHPARRHSRKHRRGPLSPPAICAAGSGARGHRGQSERVSGRRQPGSRRRHGALVSRSARNPKIVPDKTARLRKGDLRRTPSGSRYRDASIRARTRGSRRGSAGQATSTGHAASRTRTRRQARTPGVQAVDAALRCRGTRSRPGIARAG